MLLCLLCGEELKYSIYRRDSQVFHVYRCDRCGYLRVCTDSYIFLEARKKGIV